MIEIAIPMKIHTKNPQQIKFIHKKNLIPIRILTFSHLNQTTVTLVDLL